MVFAILRRIYPPVFVFVRSIVSYFTPAVKAKNEIPVGRFRQNPSREIRGAHFTFFLLYATLLVCYVADLPFGPLNPKEEPDHEKTDLHKSARPLRRLGSDPAGHCLPDGP